MADHLANARSVAWQSQLAAMELQVAEYNASLTIPSDDDGSSSGLDDDEQVGGGGGGGGDSGSRLSRSVHWGDDDVVDGSADSLDQEIHQLEKELFPSAGRAPPTSTAIVTTAPAVIAASASATDTAVAIHAANTAVKVRATEAPQSANAAATTTTTLNAAGELATEVAIGGRRGAVRSRVSEEAVKWMLEGEGGGAEDSEPTTPLAIEADARKDWEEAGYDAKTFTMAAYNVLLGSGEGGEPTAPLALENGPADGPVEEPQTNPSSTDLPTDRLADPDVGDPPAEHLVPNRPLTIQGGADDGSSEEYSNDEFEAETGRKDQTPADRPPPFTEVHGGDARSCEDSDDEEEDSAAELYNSRNDVGSDACAHTVAIHESEHGSRNNVRSDARAHIVAVYEPEPDHATTPHQTTPAACVRFTPHSNLPATPTVPTPSPPAPASPASPASPTWTLHIRTPTNSVTTLHAVVPSLSVRTIKHYVTIQRRAPGGAGSRLVFVSALSRY